MSTERGRERNVAIRDRERHGQPSAHEDQEHRDQESWPEEMERFFDRMMRTFETWAQSRQSLRGRRPVGQGDEWLPDMDVFERDDKVVIRADLPGMDPEDIDVDVEGDILVIQGTRQEEREVDEEDYHCAERSIGAFYRAITLPQAADPEDIEANYREGVLELRVPRPPTPETKKLRVPVK